MGTRIVRRSNMLQADLANEPYGTTLNFTEYALLPSEKAAQGLKATMPSDLDNQAGIMPVGKSGLPFDKEVDLLGHKGKLFGDGEGPQIDDMGEAWTGFFLYAETA